MTVTADPVQKLDTIVRQHAMTSKLLGVDFVPCYRTAGTDERIVEVKPAGGDVPPSTPPTDTARTEPAATPAGPLSIEDAQRALDALRERYIEDAPHRHFVTDHHSIVFGEGHPRARLMFIGEAPGADEDRTGRPFVGRAGQLLDKMIAAMGLRREDVYITNVLKTRPPNNQTPTAEEARLCAPYLFEQIRIVAPEAIVTLGRPASQLVLGVAEPIGRLRGHWAEFPPDDPLIDAGDIGPIPVMPTYHPAFLLRQYTADNRARVWSDLQQVMDLLGLRPGG